MMIAKLAEIQHKFFLENHPEFPALGAENESISQAEYSIVIDDAIHAEAWTAHKSEATWGKNCWLNYASYGFINQNSLKSLFTTIAQFEYDRGTNNFYVEVDAKDTQTITTWFELGFGLQHVSGVLRNLELLTNVNQIQTRELRIEDLPAIADLERELNFHQKASPVFSKVEPQSVEEIVSEWREEISNDKFVCQVVEVDKRVIGFAYGCSTERSSLHSGLLRPKNSATLAFCTVLPEFRRGGIAKALTSAVVTGLQQRGFEHIVTDWRATNQLSSVTWPSLGFEPTIYRLHRAI